MRLIKIFSCLSLIFLISTTIAQIPTIQLKQSGNRISLRGLSVVDAQTIWASGNNGMVAKSIDGGSHFEWIKVTGYEKRDFRDIEGFDKNTAVIMGVDAPAIILRTTDGGQHWQKVFEDTTKGMFLDAMDFSDNKHGIVIGDPINGNAYLASTANGGENWQKLTTPSIPVNEGEAFFASSGSNISLLNSTTKFVFATGGKSARLFVNYNTPITLPILQGEQSTGANSLAIFKNKGMIVGGDFAKDTVQKGNAVLFNLKQSGQFSFPTTPPHGYRSSVIYLNEQDLICCGTSSVDISHDGGLNWILLSKDSYHVVKKAKNGQTVWLAGSNGKIAQIIF